MVGVVGEWWEGGMRGSDRSGGRGVVDKLWWEVGRSGGRLVRVVVGGW